MKTIPIILAFCILSSPTYAEQIDDSRAVNAIIGEAENQGAQGMLAVACAIRNRGTLKGVYGEKNKRVINKRYTEKIYYIAKSAWVVSENPDRCTFLDGADHWENVGTFGEPTWANKMKETYRWKDHVFYAKKK